MKNFITYFFLFQTLLLSTFAYATKTYQVIDPHWEHEKEYSSLGKTIFKEGRLWIIEANKKPNSHQLKYLRPVSGKEKSYYPSLPKNLIHLYPFDSALLNQVEMENIKRTVDEVTGFKNRGAGSEDNLKLAKLLMDQFKSLGYEAALDCFSGNECNVVAQKNGRVNPKKVILVVAHFDSVGKSFAGADDNASGIAVMMEMARVMSLYDNNFSFRFLASNSEELGLIGSKDYVNKMSLQGQISQLSLVINMDMVGYNSNGVVELETSAEFEPLAKWFSKLAIQFTRLRPKITIGAWGSDHVPFLQKNVPTILTIEDWNTKTPCYHMACDLPATLNYDYAKEIAKLNLSAIFAKDSE